MKRPSLQLLGLAEGTVLTGPHSIHLDITNGCNTNCITCWDHSPLLDIRRPRQWKRQRVELREMETLLDDALGLGGLEAIVLSGMGEPFTHPRVYDLIRAVKERGLHLTVITNLVAADAERIIELGVDQLLIGIHGASEAAYRAFHPSFRRNEWSRLHAMLSRFRDAGRAYKHVQVVCDVNAHELVEMVELGSEYGAQQVTFKLASLKAGTQDCRIRPEQREELLESLLPRARARAQSLGVHTNLSVFAMQLEAMQSDRAGGATAPIRDIGCFMGHSYARILVDGTVLYCCNVDVKVGHLDEARFSELWHGPSWNALRARMRRGEYFDSCNQCGKLNQNQAIRERVRKHFGEAKLREITGAQ